MSPQPSEQSRALPAPPCVVAPTIAPTDFGTFYSATLGPLRRFLSKLMGNRTEAQDIAHDAYLKTYEAMHTQPVAQPTAYLYTTAKHMAMRHQVRRASRMQPTDPGVLEMQAGPTTNLVDEVVAREQAQAFDAAVLALPPGCRQVLILQLKHGLSHAQIAQKLAISPSTVAKHLARALRLLREHVPLDDCLTDHNNSHSA